MVNIPYRYQFVKDSERQSRCSSLRHFRRLLVAALDLETS